MFTRQLLCGHCGYMKKITMLTVLILFFSGLLYAEIHPRYYYEDQQSSEEDITIEVIDVDKECCIFCRRQGVEIEAKVLEVKKSKTGLKKNDTIRIKYERFHPPAGWVGPRPMPLLKEGNTYPAFIFKKDGFYRPSARGFSFTRLENPGP